MNHTSTTFVRRGVSLALASVLTLGPVAVRSSAAPSAPSPTPMEESYQVPIRALESTAPLSAIKEAFSKAFGDSVTVTVGQDGAQTARIQTQHMVIQLFGSKYDANVSSILDADTALEGIQEATVLSTRQDVYTSGFFFTSQKEVTVPDVFTIPLHLDEHDSQTLSIAVDYMNDSKGGGKPYPTPVTLSLSMADKVLDVAPLQRLADQYRSADLSSYSQDTAQALRDALARADALIASGGSYQEVNQCYQELQQAYAALSQPQVVSLADYSAVDAALKKVPSSLEGYTQASVAALRAAIAQVERGLPAREQARVDAMAKAIEEAIAHLEEAEMLRPGQYLVPITSLVSAAPLEPVQEAFSKAFGNRVVVTVKEDGTKVARVDNHHMVISMFGKTFDANVSAILDANADTPEKEAATVLSTKEEVYTPGMEAQENLPITVPAQLEFPLHTDEQGAQKLSITVDFIDAFLGGGKPYPTTVTLTLNWDAAMPDTDDLEALIQRCQTITPEFYTQESYDTLEKALDHAKAVAAKPSTPQEVQKALAQLTRAWEDLEYKLANYQAVYDALSKIPADPTPYTPESWAVLEAARADVVNGLDITQQARVDGYAAALTAALAQLQLATQEATPSPAPTADPQHLADGVYELPVALWHAAQDKASMAAASFHNTARVVVKGGAMTVYVYTQPLSFGNLTASLQEMKVQQASGAWVTAQVASRSDDGAPTSFSFPLDALRPFLSVKVNPKVDLMGHQDLDARLKFDLSALHAVSQDASQAPATPPADTPVPQTGDVSALPLWAALMALSAGGAGVLAVSRRKSSRS